LASPGDVQTERIIAGEVVSELTHTIGEDMGIAFKLLTYEQYAVPGLGTDAQEVVNESVPSDYDIFISVFWTRIGTPTKRASSGSVEELELALKKYENGEDVRVMMYFKTSSPDSLGEIDEGFIKVKELKTRSESLGLYIPFREPDDFEKILRVNLTQYILKNFKANKKRVLDQSVVPVDEVSVVNAVGEQSRLKKRVDILLEGVNFSLEEHVGVFDLADQFSLDSAGLTRILNEMSEIMASLTVIVGRRTIELTRANKITDTRLRMTKQKSTLDSLANEMEVVSDGYEDRFMEFKDSMHSMFDIINKLFGIWGKDMPREVLTSTSSLNNSLEGAVEGLAQLIVQIDDTPALTSKFSKSKLRQNTVLKKWIDEMVQGQSILEKVLEKRY